MARPVSARGGNRKRSEPKNQSKTNAGQVPESPRLYESNPLRRENVDLHRIIAAVDGVLSKLEEYEAFIRDERLEGTDLRNYPAAETQADVTRWGAIFSEFGKLLIVIGKRSDELERRLQPTGVAGGLIFGGGEHEMAFALSDTQTVLGRLRAEIAELEQSQVLPGITATSALRRARSRLDALTEAANGEPAAASAVVGKSKRRGRRQDSNPVADANLRDEWQESGCATYAQFAAMKGISDVDEVEAAIDRARKRP